MPSVATELRGYPPHFYKEKELAANVWIFHVDLLSVSMEIGCRAQVAPPFPHLKCLLTLTSMQLCVSLAQTALPTFEKSTFQDAF